jgi:hypothetical protein
MKIISMRSRSQAETPTCKVIEPSSRIDPTEAQVRNAPALYD